MKKKLKTSLTLVFFLGVTALILFTVTYQSNYFSKAQEKEIINNEPSPSEIVEKYWELSSRGFFEEAEKLNTYCELPSTIPGEGTVCGKPVENETHSQLIYRLKTSLLKVEREFIKDRKAIVIITVSDAKDRTSKDQYELLLTEDGWRIRSSHSAGLYKCEFIPEFCDSEKN